MNTKIERLRLLLSKIQHVSETRISFHDLAEMINSEYNIEILSNPNLEENLYLNDLRQTRDKQLRELDDNKFNLAKRNLCFNEVISNFEMDIIHEITRLELDMIV